MHCPECGFVNAEGANYCQKCGAFLGEAEAGKPGDTTEVYQVDETGELKAGRPRGGHPRGRHAGDPLGRRARGRGLQRDRRAHDDRAQPRGRGLPRRRDRLAQPRAAGAPPRRALHRRPRLAERHLREPAPDRVAPARRTATSCRSASTSSPTWTSDEHRGRQRAAAAQGEGAHDRGRRQAARARVPRHLDLEDPLPGGPEAALAAAHAGRLPPLRARPTWTGCARSCASSATSSCRCA